MHRQQVKGEVGILRWTITLFCAGKKTTSKPEKLVFLLRKVKNVKSIKLQLTKPLPIFLLFISVFFTLKLFKRKLISLQLVCYFFSIIK